MPPKEVEDILGYPLAENVEDAKMVKVLEDDFGEIADAVIAGFESGSSSRRSRRATSRGL